MNLQHLRYFHELYHTLHYTKTAEKLFITQPTLTYSIKKLEEEIGSKLFTYENNLLHITPAGYEFYQYVEQVLDLMSDGLVAMEKYQDGQQNINIGAIPTTLSHYLPNMLLNAPESIHFKVHNDLSINIASRVKDNTYHLGIASTDSTADLNCIPIFSASFIAVVRKDHPLAAKDAIKIKDLEGEKIITYLEQLYDGQAVLNIFKKNLENYHLLQITNSDEFIKGLVTANKDVAVVVDIPLYHNDSLKRLPIEDLDIERQIYLIYKEKVWEKLGMINFIEYCIEFSDGYKKEFGDKLNRYI